MAWCTDEDRKQIFKTFDLDGDGNISLEEFVSVMSKKLLDSKYSTFTARNITKLPTFLTYDPVAKSDSKRVVSEMSGMEKAVVSVIYRMSSTSLQNNVDQNAPIHSLSDKDRVSVRFHINKAIVLAAVAGAAAAAACILFENWLLKEMDTDGKYKGYPPNQGYLIFQLANLGISGVVSCIELAVVYFGALWSSVMLARIAKLNLWPMDYERSLVAGALARASFELEHPADTRLGIDPRKGSSGWVLMLAALCFAGRRGISKFLFRIFLKKVIARAAAKALLDWIAIPVNILWNVLTVRSCMNDSKNCILGPSAMIHMLQELLNNRDELRSETYVFMLRAIGAVIVQARRFHPNLFHAIHFIEDSFITDSVVRGNTPKTSYRTLDDIDGQPGWASRLASWAKDKVEASSQATMYGDEARRHKQLLPMELDEVTLFVDGIRDLPENELDIVLGVLVCAIIIDGNVSGKEKRLLDRTLRKIDRQANFEQVRHLTYLFTTGQAITRDDILKTFSDERSSLSNKELCSQRCSQVLDCINIC